MSFARAGHRQAGSGLVKVVSGGPGTELRGQGHLGAEKVERFC